MLQLVTRLCLAALLAVPLLAVAATGIPAAYAPVVIEPTGAPAQVEFDLTAVQARAKKENKRLYLYLGADDCRYCRRYEAFLDKNAAELVPEFKKHRYLIVDLRSSLSYVSNKVFFRVGSSTLAYSDFQRSIGDERARMLVYPNVWVLDTNLKPLMAMPTGTGTFETVDEQLEILRLEQ